MHTIRAGMWLRHRRLQLAARRCEWLTMNTIVTRTTMPGWRCAPDTNAATAIAEDTTDGLQGDAAAIDAERHSEPCCSRRLRSRRRIV